VSASPLLSLTISGCLCSRILAVELLKLEIQFGLFGPQLARFLEESLGCDSEELGRVGRAVTDSLREVLEFSES
jgi:hypothetical protein